MVTHEIPNTFFFKVNALRREAGLGASGVEKETTQDLRTAQLEIRLSKGGGEVGREKDSSRGDKILFWKSGAGDREDNTPLTLWFPFWATCPSPTKTSRACGFLGEPDLPHADENVSVPVAVVASDSIWLPCPQATYNSPRTLDEVSTLRILLRILQITPCQNNDSFSWEQLFFFVSTEQDSCSGCCNVHQSPYAKGRPPADSGSQFPLLLRIALGWWEPFAQDVMTPLKTAHSQWLMWGHKRPPALGE